LYKRRTITRYSLAFKQRVVSEVEAGRYTVSEAKRVYDIKGAQTIKVWAEKLGKEHLLARSSENRDEG